MPKNQQPEPETPEKSLVKTISITPATFSLGEAQAKATNRNFSNHVSTLILEAEKTASNKTT